MEAALASGVLKVAGNKLVQLVTGEFASIIGVTKDLSELQVLHGEITSWLSAVWDRAMENDPSFRWVQNLTDVACDIDNLLHEVHLEAEKHDMDIDGDNHFISKFCAKPKSIMFRCKIAHKIKSINARFAAIVKQRSNVNVVVNSLQMHEVVRNVRQTFGELSLLGSVEVSKISTRDKEKDSIVSKLLEYNEGDKVLTVSIIGLGGSGKTTLAKHICHDDMIKTHFRATYWVHVSQEFNMEKLIGKLFEAITGNKFDLHSQQHIINVVSDKLRDDAWYDSQHDSEQFMVYVYNGESGSRILLTTRDQQVADAVKSRFLFNLAFLSESSGLVEKDMISEFIQVRKEIMRKCGGVPLAVKTLAGILSEKKEIHTWRAIGGIINKDTLIAQWIAHGFINTSNGERPEDTGSDYFDSLVKVGFLQYVVGDAYNDELRCKIHDLIHDLSQEILQDKMVATLPKNMTRNHTPRCIYLSLINCTEKVNWGLFKNIHAIHVSGGNPSFGKQIKKHRCIRSVILEDIVVTSFPLFILKFEYLGYFRISETFQKLFQAVGICKQLHVTNCTGFAKLPESIGMLKKLRTLELWRAGDLKNLPQSIGDCRNLRKSVGKLRNLRMIELECCGNIQDVPSSFAFQLLHTLKLSQSNITMLPQCITLMENLEYIDLGYCLMLEDLPKGIVNLKRLEVLHLMGCDKLRCLPLGFGRLTRLKRLGLFVIGCGGDDAQISGLGNLGQISGDMVIMNIKHSKDANDADNAHLKQNSNIESLALSWGREVEEQTTSDHELDVLNALEPSSGIKDLQIYGYGGSHPPRWIMSQRSAELHLVNLPNLKYLRGIVELPWLKILLLRCMPNLEELWTTTTGLSDGDHCFPRLSNLTIESCLKLNIIPHFPPSMESLSLKGINERLLALPSCNSRGGLVEFPCLKKPELHAGWERIMHHGFAVLESLRIYGSDDLRQLPESIRSITCLERLVIFRYPAIEVLPRWLGELCSLRHLHIQMANLRELPEGLTSLKTLAISCCMKLSKLPEGIRHLKYLEHLTIKQCHAILRLPEALGELGSLKVLVLSGLQELMSLPESMQGLTSLQRFHLTSCPALTVLPDSLGQLPTLGALYIDSCHGLRSLPRSIKRLTSLRYLMISYCPALSRHYKVRVGSDWHLVSHIRQVELIRANITVYMVMSSGLVAL
uniref:NB-ARC domain-containing protein n=1 Tax=Leersia perrieri TaxID=77586 RepID=A0A0D9XNL3_9ORYZ